MTQPIALRLAEMFDSLKLTVVGAQNALPMEEAAAELRRQYEEIKCEERRFGELWEQFAALVKTNEELLNLLIRYRHETPLGNQPYMIAIEADAALAKAPEKTE